MRQVMEESSSGIGYLELVASNRDFRLLWAGQIVSLFGDWFNLIASASLIAMLTQSGLAVGGLFVVRMLAPFLISPVAGVAADRYNRKSLLILTDVLRALAVLGFLLVREPGHVWLLYSLTAFQLALGGIFFPTRTAILPEIVSPRELGAANALSGATWSVMLAVGAALGGLVSGIWGIYPAFVIDSVTFILSAVLISGLAYRPSKDLLEPDDVGSSAMVQYLDGLRFLGGHRDILAIALQKAAMGLMVGGGLQVLQVALAERVYPLGEGGGISLGIMFAILGAGTGLGPIAARVFTGDRERPLRYAILLSYVLAGLGLALIGPLWSFTWVLVGIFVRALGGGINWVFSSQLLLQLTPDQVRGRVFSAEFAIFTLAMAFSSAAGGWLLDSTGLGIAGTINIMLGGTSVAGLLWLLWLTRMKGAGSRNRNSTPPPEPVV